MSNWLGFTWQKIEGVFLFASDSNHQVGASGGEENHTLSVNEMPSHNHRIWTTNTWSQNAVGLKYNNNAYGVGGVDQSGGTEQWANTENGDNHQIIESTGGGQPHNNMPPYKVVSIWKRTA